MTRSRLAIALLATACWCSHAAAQDAPPGEAPKSDKPAADPAKTGPGAAKAAPDPFPPTPLELQEKKNSEEYVKICKQC